MTSSPREIAERAGFLVTDEAMVPGRDPRYAPLPADLHPTLLDFLATFHPDGIYAHQANALTCLAAGEDVCLATPTASGKSLVFLAHAAELLLRDPQARVVAFYPAKALIQDQLEKWRGLLEPLGFPVGYIDGGVSPASRADILRSSRALLMTPDVAHAWLMSNLEAEPVRKLLAALRLLVLDEAHVYEGVFGTNMAYLLRRFQAVAAPHRLVCSTATIEDPVGFVEKLAGRRVTVFGEGDNGARVADRRVLAIQPIEHDRFEGIVALVRELGDSYSGRFLVFADSRRMVELVVAGLSRGEESVESDTEMTAVAGVLPYRAGYEENDRARIQKALQTGELKGVVSTSAMELGLDIGEIDLVVLLGVPPTMKSFWQRIGRAGRRQAGTCLMLDDAGSVGAVSSSLAGYLERPLEPSWLYLDNRYIQYAHALCMAIETRAWAGRRQDVALPQTFQEMVDNEIEQTEMVAPDLYPLKQRAQGDPHHQFPLRSGIEPSLQVDGPFLKLGSLTWSQVLREAYPGGVYYYMAKPFRITRIQYRRQRIEAKREGPLVTHPISQVMVFPSFEDPMALWRSDRGFVTEVPMQVSERVLGFREHRGKKKVEHHYGPFSTWSRRELTRFFETTGVCWFFDDPELLSDPVGQALLDAFSLRFGVQRSDLGVGPFFAKHSPLGAEKCRGICIYDATHGSLRLTQRFGQHLGEVLDTALVQAENDEALTSVLRRLADALGDLRLADFGVVGGPPPPGDADIVDVVAAGERAMHITAHEAREVRIAGWRYTPHGLMYELEADEVGLKQMVPAHAVAPLRGESRMLRVNLVTGEEVGA